MQSVKCVFSFSSALPAPPPACSPAEVFSAPSLPADPLPGGGHSVPRHHEPLNHLSDKCRLATAELERVFKRQ